MIPQTVAFDETAMPQPQPEHEMVVVGPRTTPQQAQAIRAAGSSLAVKIQPVRWLHADGSPEMGWQWDRSLSLLPLLKKNDGTNAGMAEPGQGMDGSYVIDFGAAGTAHGMAVLAWQLCGSLGAVGVVIDYGCADLSWVSPLVGKVDWTKWTAGYGAYRSDLVSRRKRVWNACNVQVTPNASLCIEGISPNGKDIGYPPSYKQVFAAASANRFTMLLIQNDDVTHRRIICGIALATGALVNYRPQFFTAEGRWQNQIPPEMEF